TFLCIAGIVTLKNSDPNVSGSEQCPAGSTVDVAQGKPPSKPKPATKEQIELFVQDTSSAEVGSMSQTTGQPGQTIDVVIKGANMDKITGVSVNGAGLTAALNGQPTKEQVNVKLTIAKDAEPGARTLVFAQSSGKEAFAVFNVGEPGKKPLP